jgi:two-component system, NarL family, nitrate/nitrite response regulator NarL
MAAVAICSADPVRRRELAERLGAQPQTSVAGVTADLAAALELIAGSPVDAVVADAPPPGQLTEWRARRVPAALVVLIDEADEDAGLDALHADARAILPRSAGGAEIAAAIAAAGHGLATLPRRLIEALIDAGANDGDEPPQDGGAALTPRELEVLAAMADGASNKAIARRLGISFHTAKFHVAAILAKLDADSRTEAVARAAHLGLVML